MPDWEQLKEELLEWFDAKQLEVAVGLKPGGGLVIRSQDEWVDAQNIGTVEVQRGVEVSR